MRLRKPITEAARYHREMKEVKDITRASAIAEGKPGSLRSTKQVVTIYVAGCKGLEGTHGSAAHMAPFFHY